MYEISAIAKILNYATGEVEGVALASGVAFFVVTPEGFRALSSNPDFEIEPHNTDTVRNIILRSTYQLDPITQTPYFIKPLQPEDFTHWLDVPTLIEETKPADRTAALITVSEYVDEHNTVDLEEVRIDLTNNIVLEYGVNEGIPKEAAVLSDYNSPITYSSVIFKIWEAFAVDNSRPFTFSSIDELIQCHAPSTSLMFSIDNGYLLED